MSRVRELECVITDLIAENKMLRNELKQISLALDDPRTDLTMTMVEIIKEMKHEQDPIPRL